ncbi:MAG: long-chain fatty acid--CoA ligase [Bryobacterales bacterium]|nr:long-chain fatty acid--CoA ligase [Bryobacterales bacterium]
MPLYLKGSAPLVLTPEKSYSRDDIGILATELCHQLTRSGASRILITSDDAVQLLAAVAAISRVNADLWIAPTSVPAAELKALAEAQQIHLLISPTERVAFTARRTPGSGRICLMTSGTTGRPKVAAHSLEKLAGRALASASASLPQGTRWLLTYQPTAFAGMQVLLTAAFAEGAIVVPAHRDPVSWFEAAQHHDVTHISGTPTFWRAFLMVATPGSLPLLAQATLGGEAIDQPTLDRIHHAFPKARVTHIYASTEAGVVFSVNDGVAGFPAAWLDTTVQGVGLRVREGMLEVRTSRSMLGYVSEHAVPLTEDGWLRTFDRIEVDGDRARFLGRDDSIINVGGAKVHPHTIEAFLLSLPGIVEARVFGVPNPITGFVVGAEVVAAADENPAALRLEILKQCQAQLPRTHAPRVLNFVTNIRVAESGKKG